MVWKEYSYEVEEEHPLGQSRAPDTVAFHQGLFRFYQSAIQLRHKTEALRSGKFDVLRADDQKNVLVFSRSTAEESVIVALNRSETDREVEVRLPSLDSGLYKPLFATQPHSGEERVNNGVLRLSVPALTGIVFQRKGR